MVQPDGRAAPRALPRCASDWSMTPDSLPPGRGGCRLECSLPRPTGDPMNSPIPGRLAALRDAMRHHGFSHYLVPTSDPHLSEYPPAWWRRREYLTGFTGSAGTALIGLERAWLWADGRYWLQAEAEL